MGSSLTLFIILKRNKHKRPSRCRFEFSGAFLVVAALFIYLDTESTLIWIGLAVCFHELGHCGAAVLAGGRVHCLRMTLAGGCIELDPGYPLSYAGEMAVVLAGPAANLVLSVLAARLAPWGESLYVLAGSSLVLGGFNLLPIYPLDGGRLVRLVLTAFFTPDRAVWVVQVCSLFCAAGLITASGGTLAASGQGSAAALWIGIWLLISGLSEKWV